MESIEANVHVGEGIIVVRRKGSSSPAIANVLGSVPTEGATLLYLDRLVHRPHENELGGYIIKGAISSILTVPHALVTTAADA